MCEKSLPEHVIKKSHLEDHYANELNRLLENNIIEHYYSHDLIHSKDIGFGGFASVFVAKWKNTPTKYAIKKFVDNKEVYLTKTVNPHANIIQFYGVTKKKDEEKYSLVLEYAEGGTLRDCLRNNTIEWNNQLRFAREIASAILWLHVDKGIVHGDLHPNNILVHKDTIKLADFGRSFETGKGCDNTEVWGVMPYVDPKMLDQTVPYKLNEKSDIYCLGFLFWELTSRTSPFDGLGDYDVTLKILSGVREEPVPNTNVKFIGLYQKCWKQEPDERSNISEVNETLSSIDSENNNVSTVPYSKGSEESEKTEFEHSCQIDYVAFYISRSYDFSLSDNTSNPSKSSKINFKDNDSKESSRLFKKLKMENVDEQNDYEREIMQQRSNISINGK
uniref:Protein kinase domain-containing protein n=1 Tax=Rhizophagus irregularis (strain DAOM 181602 / DAOM 197198 / MUCL 43194) TaxID=747089 RepID=U9ULH8_RHIID